MKRMLNTLYVTTQGAYLHLQGETVVVRIEDETRLRMPLHNLEGLVCFERVACSPQLLFACAERNVSVSFLGFGGRFLARVQGPVSGNVLLRRQQYRRADDSHGAAAVAHSVVAAKVANARTVLLRAARQHGQPASADALRQAADELGSLLERLQEPLSLDTIRGLEGVAAKTYFGVFDHLILSQKESFRFEKRTRRPPLDNINSLLSFVYVLLVHDAASALESVGLDPAVGFLHRDRPGRPGLALDLAEEFRSALADRLVLSLVNRQQVQPRGFQKTDTGAVLMDDDTRKTVITAYQERKQEEIQHPFLGERLSVGLLFHAQALLLARFLRGDLEAYPSFFWR